MDEFFEEVDSLGVVESHIRKIVRLEEKEASQLSEIYRTSRENVLGRLARARPDSFTAQQARGTLAQIDSALKAIEKSLRGRMLKGARLAAETGVEDLIREMRTFEDYFTGAVTPINVDAAAIAGDLENYLFNQYEASIKSYTSDLRDLMANRLQSAIVEQLPYTDIVKSIGTFFLGEEWKIHRIARTELHQIYGQAKLRGMGELQESTMPDLLKTLIHPMDARTADDSKYVRALNLIVPVNEPFRYYWPPQDPAERARYAKGSRSPSKLREYMTPPDRPNDRSILVPYRPSWQA